MVAIFQNHLSEKVFRELVLHLLRLQGSCCILTAYIVFSRCVGKLNLKKERKLVRLKKAWTAKRSFIYSVLGC